MNVMGTVPLATNCPYSSTGATLMPPDPDSDSEWTRKYARGWGWVASWVWIDCICSDVKVALLVESDQPGSEMCLDGEATKAGKANQ